MSDFVQLELFDLAPYSKPNICVYDRLRTSIEEGMYKIFNNIWDFEIHDRKLNKRRKLDLEKLLLSLGYLNKLKRNIFSRKLGKRIVNIDGEIVGLNRADSLKMIDINTKYLEIIRRTQPYLQKIQFYTLTLSTSAMNTIYIYARGDLIYYDNIYIIARKTFENEWVCFSIAPNTNGLKGERQTDIDSLDSSTLEVISIFQEVTDSFSFPLIEYSNIFEYFELEGPFKSFIWEAASSKSLSIARILKSIGFMQIEPLNSSKNWKRIRKRIWDLEVGKCYDFFDMLETNLCNLRLYWFGWSETFIEILGEAIEGDRLRICSISA